MDKIDINNISLYDYHGVLPEEREQGQEFLITISLEVNLQGISKTDDIEDTVDYSKICSMVKEISAREPCRLIETLAEKISHEILYFFPQVKRITVTVIKPNPPLPEVTDGVSATVVRSGSK